MTEIPEHRGEFGPEEDRRERQDVRDAGYIAQA